MDLHLGVPFLRHEHLEVFKAERPSSVLRVLTRGMKQVLHVFPLRTHEVPVHPPAEMPILCDEILVELCYFDVVLCMIVGF